MSTLTIETWNTRYRPEYNFLAEEEASFDGTMFETYGDEVAYVQNVSPTRVWTYIDTDNGGLAIVNGYHLVNRIGHFVTDRPWDTDVTVVLEEGTEENVVLCGDCLYPIDTCYHGTQR